MNLYVHFLTAFNTDQLQAVLLGRHRLYDAGYDISLVFWGLRRFHSRPMLLGNGAGLTTLEGWRPRRDLNPCYRRERAMS